MRPETCPDAGHSIGDCFGVLGAGWIGGCNFGHREMCGHPFDRLNAGHSGGESNTTINKQGKAISKSSIES
jgi:hypothetical protein